MGLLSGKINSFSKDTLIFERGDDIDFIAYIHKGSVIKTNDTDTFTVDEGNFICYDDIYSGFYSYDYTVEAGSEIIPIPASNPLDIVHFYNSNKAVHRDNTLLVCRLCSGLYDMYETLYGLVSNFFDSLKDSYDAYLNICEREGISPVSFDMPHNTDSYSLSEQAFGKNLLILKSLALDPEKEKSLNINSGEKYLKLQIDIINKVYVAYDDMFFYLKSLVETFASDNDECLFAIISKLAEDTNNMSALELLWEMKTIITSIDEEVKNTLDYDLDIDYNRVNFYFMVANDNSKPSEVSDIDLSVEPEIASPIQDAIIPAIEYEDCDLNDILLQLCNYADFEKDKYDFLNSCVTHFLSLKDKYSKDADARAFRKTFSERYYELYQAVFFKYATSNTASILVKLFLDFGLLDERLVTDMQIQELLNIPPLNEDENCHVYRMSDWLLKVYNNEEIPSKNEFDQEYVDYVRELKKNLGLSAIEERNLLEDNVSKVNFEIQNMLKCNSRLLSGNLLAFYPMLHMDSFEQSFDAYSVTTESIVSSINTWKEYDYSVFYREIMFSDEKQKIEKEVIQKEIYPIFILFPVAGVNGVMWQDISGKRSNSQGRFFLPSFFNGTLDDVILTMLGRFRWELCKTMQGVAWNNIQVPSLTSEFIDYIQFYRKNKELTADKKEAIKTQLVKCRNNMRDFFVTDYSIWLKYEATGAMRLNKFSRRILATYCPLSIKYREKLASQPLFDEAMKRFNVSRGKKIKEYQARMAYYQSKGRTIPDELIETRSFYDK